MDKFLLLIDGSSLLTTQFFGNLPSDIMFAKTDEEKAKYFHKIMQTSKGVYTNAVYGFMRTLIKIISDQKPSHIGVAWDLTRDTFRRELYADYKGNRGETLAPLKSQFALCQEVLSRIGIRQFMDLRYEADDFCGSVTRRFEDQVPVKILTKDHDYLQLVDERTELWMMHTSTKNAEEMYKKYKLKPDGSVPDKCFGLNPVLVEQEFGVKPASIADLKGLQGDSSDNIKGVPGVGPKTAVALIARYGTVEALYEAMEGLDDKGLKELAASWKDIGVARSPINNLLKSSDTELVGKEAALLSKRLATIKCDIDLGDLSLSDLELSISSQEAAKVFEELEFKSLKADFGGEAQAEETFTIKETSDLEEVDRLEKLISGQAKLGLALMEDESGLLGLALATGPDLVTLVKLEGFITRDRLADLVIKADSAGVRLAAYDIKKLIKKLGIARLAHAFDNMLAAYLLDPLAGSYEPQTGPDPTQSACKVARRALMEADRYEAALKEAEMMEVFTDIEMPLCFVLAAMEREGILVNAQALDDFAAQLSVDIKRLESSIWYRAGEEFNINSPKQLGTILFDKLRLPYGKKTKSGYSTSAEVLEKLKAEDPIVEEILEYRQLTKLKSTYADGLKDYIDEDGRIRTSFNQTVTATGRLSSTEPNLQNIPIRTELGRLIRKCFIPKPGYIFVDADYSQIELRILAAMSGDKQLIDAYQKSEDIHRATAAAVFHVPIEEVTPTLRSRAKAVNFGIVYGISSFGLGNDLNISRKEAEGYIEAYFETYPDIKRFLNGLVASAKDLGYAKTLFGRRRAIPELSSENFMQRQFGERVAMNSPIQGTAADIIKLAMLKVADRLERELPEARLLLQIHDELLVEAPLGTEDWVKQLMEEEMKNAVSLAVPLEVGTEMGMDWSEAH